MRLFVDVRRGDLVESRHQVAFAVARSDGALAAASGDTTTPTFWRSCAKFFQAVPALTGGAADALGVDQEELALACASHNGEPRHVAVALRLLARSGAGPDHLACGPHASLNDEVAKAMRERGEAPTRAHNNCSGKHALMIGAARHAGVGSDGYHRPGHPWQRRILREVAAWVGRAEDAVPHATDGCGVPSFAIPLSAMAAAYARLAAVSAGDAVPGLPADAAEAGRTLVTAVRAHPFLIAGTGRLDTELLEAGAGRVVAKIGAEGVYCAAIPDLRLGLALKVADGATRALAPALLALLEVVAPGSVPGLEHHRHAPIHNTLGEIVGRIEACVDPHHDA